jgi:two-component system phosphate regulon response regulator OmpR
MTGHIAFYLKGNGMNAPQAPIQAHILVIDDDERLRQLLQRYLSDQGFFVTIAADAKAAREALHYFCFDAMVLDLMMPGETGLQLAASMPADNKPPILMLTAMADPADRVRGLELGARDYLTKPFEPRELVLRLNNLLQQPAQAPSTDTREVRFGFFRFEQASGRLFKEDEPVYLTQAESALLQALAANPGHPVTRESLIALGIGGADNQNERSVDVQINRLRKKIEPLPGRPIYIRTLRGAGYILQTD